MVNSSLVTTDMPAYGGNYTQNRAKNDGKIKMIILHHTGGVIDVNALGQIWQTVGRNGSSHYGVCDNQVGQYVPENCISWTNTNWLANLNSVTIEMCNSTGAPNWEVSAQTLETTAQLVADISRRNGLGKLVVGQNLTYHSMYANTNCPGPYVLPRMQAIADRANEILAQGYQAPPISVPADTVLFTGKATGLSGQHLNVRTGAGTNYPLLAGYPQLAEGNQFDVLQRLNGWDKIRIAGKHIGYVSSAFVAQDNAAQIPISDNEFPFAAFATNLGSAHLNVRMGAGTGYPLMAEYKQLAQGNQFDVLGEQGGWYQIKIAGKYIGWVSKAYVQKS